MSVSRPLESDSLREAPNEADITTPIDTGQNDVVRGLSAAEPTLAAILQTSGSKSPEKCPICLNIPEDRAYTDSCYHEFCYVCLLEWSKVKAECPLCKQKFKNIIHNIRSADDYDKYEIPTETESFGIDDAGQRFRFPTTMTVERVELLRLIRQLHLQIQEMERNNVLLQRNRQMYLRQLARVRRLRHLFERSAERRERLTATSDFRRVVYDRRLRAIPLLPARECSPRFYRRNPACLHRLMQWLNRELNVLMCGQPGRVDFLITLIESLLIRWPIDSPETSRFLAPYIGMYTEAFLHEFGNFARSPYDMEEYDRQVQYESWREAVTRSRRPGEAPPEITIGSSPSPEHDVDMDVDVDIDDVIQGERDNNAPFRNPSPPVSRRWSDQEPGRSDRDPRLEMLQRYETMIENSIIQLNARRSATNLALQSSLFRRREATSLTRLALARDRARNTTVDIFSSASSDEEDSPRLDSNARTPPYLLPSRKRTLDTSLMNMKRRRMLENLDGGETSTQRRDDYATNSGEYTMGTTSALPFSPAPSAAVIQHDAILSDNSVSSAGLNSTPQNFSTATASDYIVDSSPSFSSSGQTWRHSTSSARGSSTYSESDYSSYTHPGHTSYLSSDSDQWTGEDEQHRRVKMEADQWSCRSERTIHSDDPDCQVVAELRPKHLRTPELVVVDDEEEVAREQASEIQHRPATIDVDKIRKRSSSLMGARPAMSDVSKARRRSRSCMDDQPTTSAVVEPRESPESSEHKHRHKRKHHKKHRHRHRRDRHDRDGHHRHSHHRHRHGHKEKKESRKHKHRREEHRYRSSSSEDEP